MSKSSGMRVSSGLAAVLLAAVLGGCGVIPTSEAGGVSSREPSAPSSTSSPGSTPTQTPQPEPVQLSSNVKNGATKVKVDTLVKVTAANGTLSKIKLTYSGKDNRGKTQKGSVDGKLSKDRKTWTATERLEPAATYKLTMSGKNPQSQAGKASASFKTQALTLAQQTFPTLYPLKGSKVGIGMPAVLNFDVPVKNKAEFEKNLTVTTVPKQPGSWRWFSDREVRYRPKTYWKPGTKVTVAANLNGVNAGNGIYGQQSAKTSFTVGRAMTIKVNLATDVAKVYRGDKLVRTIYVSGGKPGWQTRSGVKLIMAKEYNKKMTNEMIGAEEDYELVAQYALRITNSGEFLHSAPWNTAHFGRRNASHGCVGMSNADAGWLYNNTLIGDPVITTGTGRGVEDGNGYSDWNLSYAQYKKGSAL